MAITYVVAGSKAWNKSIFESEIVTLPGSWHYIDSKDGLTPDTLATIKPRYIFFLHWSWLVPEEIVAAYDCICFHMTDLPYGRGGSPLQNLIVAGHRETMLSAIKMSPVLDAGPVYLKERLSLEGGAEEIYMRACFHSARMIEQIIRDQPVPTPQSGEIVEFKRRSPKQSAIPPGTSLQQVYDFIRMLDADGYPKAFLIAGGFKYEFQRAAIYNGKVVADVTITPVEEKS